MELVIKNMVCPRCIIAVESVLSAMRLPVEGVVLGSVVLKRGLTAAEQQDLDLRLEGMGFALLWLPDQVLVEKVKCLVIKIIHGEDGIQLKENFSDLISRATGRGYAATSTLFSAMEGITLEHYIILQRIERVKELLLYDELTLSGIADRLGYSSTQHLSTQFRKTTGLTTSVFRKTGKDTRNARDSLRP